MKTLTRNAALLVPLLLVNAAAVYGQAGWAHDHLNRGGWLWAVLFAAAVESVGVYLAFEAHEALMANHAAGALRIGSYAVGLASGALNFAHFASRGLSPNAIAVTFGVLSSISPWLWAIRSRSLNRARLAEMGLIDPRAVKFSRLRWALFPVRTFATFRAAVWSGVQSPAEAVAAYAASRTPLPPIVHEELRLSVDDRPESDDLDREWKELATSPRPTLRAVPPVQPFNRAPRPAMSGPNPEVLRLAAEGHRPAEIAPMLGVSKRTVERHLRAANGGTP